MIRSSDHVRLTKVLWTSFSETRVGLVENALLFSNSGTSFSKSSSKNDENKTVTVYWFVSIFDFIKYRARFESYCE